MKGTCRLSELIRSESLGESEGEPEKGETLWFSTVSFPCPCFLRNGGCGECSREEMLREDPGDLGASSDASWISEESTTKDFLGFLDNVEGTVFDSGADATDEIIGCDS